MAVVVAVATAATRTVYQPFITDQLIVTVFALTKAAAAAVVAVLVGCLAYQDIKYV